jgi:hypothetical protein
MRVIERAIRSADFVLIPCRVGLFDLAGIRPVIAMRRSTASRLAFCSMPSTLAHLDGTA